MEKFKIGDRVKIEPRSQAAIEVVRDEKALKKWESAGWIGFVTNVSTAPAGNKLVRVGTHPDDNGDYFFPGDLRLARPEEGVMFLVFDAEKVVAICTDFHTAQQFKNCRIQPVLINKRI